MVGLLQFLVAGRDRPVLFEPGDRALDAVALAVGRAVEAHAAPGLVGEAGDHRPDLAPAQAAPDLPPGVALVPGDPVGADARPTPWPRHRPALQQRRRLRRLLALARGRD